MSKADTRILTDADHRAAYDLVRAAQHSPPVSDTEWSYARHLYSSGLALGAFLDDTLVGTTNLLPSHLSLPGGATVPMAAATGSGVRADHTRRGVFTSLKRERLDLAVRRGYPVVGNIVSEATIYGRFGHGVGTLSRAVRLRTGQARLRPDAPAGGEVRLMDRASSVEELPRLYEQLGAYRPGIIGRAAPWWRAKWERPLSSGENLPVAVHHGAGSEDGFAVYRTTPNAEPGSSVTLLVTDFHAANPTAAAGLWRFLLNIDLVDEVCVRRLPIDELVEGILVNWRACRTHSVNDDLWLRLVDVPRALAARAYDDADPVVVEIIDEFLPANNGRYRISPDGVVTTTAPAHLTMDADALAMAYLGTTRFSTLADLGRLRVDDPRALTHADRLFAAASAPFCGTVF
ncbi:GNAT family N-acetyltransferase [Frankia sp. AgPm24]|uniref:GNAT family N-acetyltransferase n=1 Tax=Frankia sp. AgPm24 TaxID=631128 RepID=UPI00200F76DB|nr:GNAT family N-acetyltransferase [Frankia sp. AgPm24]MCK9922447.1 GNAT family N-acetyltransferase [Frankia sp. AgPm24]